MATKKNEFWIFVQFKIKIHIRRHKCFRRASGSFISGAWDVMMCVVAFNVFHSLSSWTLRRCSFKIQQKKRTSMQRRCCLRRNWNQAVHTEHIFNSFSIYHQRHISSLHSCLSQESRTFRKHVKLMSHDFMVVFLHHVFKWRKYSLRLVFAILYIHVAVLFLIVQAIELIIYVFICKHALFSKIVMLFYCFEEMCISNILLDVPKFKAPPP